MASQAASDDWSDVLKRLGVDADEADAPQHSPIDNTALAPPRVSEQQVDTEAVVAWASQDHAARQQRLKRFSAALYAHADALNLALCVETGYPIAQCRRTITACAAHFDKVAAVLRLPPDSATCVWRPRGQTSIESAANDSISDALAAIASALYCGCTVRWCAPVNAKWVARLLLTLWQRAQSDNPTARCAWTLSDHTPSGSPTDSVNLVWVTPSAPVDAAIDAILSGVCWQNGVGAASLHGILVDHALHWEIDHRLSTALAPLTRLDARDDQCQLPAHRPRPELVAVPVDAHPQRASTNQARVFLQPISTLPDGVCNYTVKSLSVFSIDLREIEHVRNHLTHTSSQVCINTVPSEDLAMQQSDWHPWLHPRAIRTAVDAPW